MAPRSPLLGGSALSATFISNYPHINTYAHAPKHELLQTDTLKKRGVAIKQIFSVMQMYSDKLRFTHMHSNAHTHALPTISLLCHLLTHIHNVFLSPAAHQGLGKLPGMKEICSLMALFHAYGGTRCSWAFFFLLLLQKPRVQL